MYYAIIVAGGKGLRMGGNVPKQFQLVGGRPVLMHTLQQFRNAMADLQIILVLPREQQDYWRERCRQYEFGVEHRVADGGQTRFHSVKNGLALIPDGEEGIVGVHDGVRPFASADLIRRCYAAAVEAEAVVPAVPVVESLRHEERGAIDRKGYRLVQTPQTFSIPLLKAAYCQAYLETFTDDASVVEAYGHRVAMIDGIRENIKLTTPFDMVVAEALLAESEK